MSKPAECQPDLAWCSGDPDLGDRTITMNFSHLHTAFLPCSNEHLGGTTGA